MKKQTIIDEIEISDLADLFKVFSDSTRLKILRLLYNGEFNVNDIAKQLSMNQSAISHQLQKLRTFKLIKSRRDGQTIYYSLNDDHVYQIIGQGLEHINE